MQFGDLELTPLFDGYLRLDGGAMFGTVPKPLWQKRAPADDKNRITLAMRPLLVRSAAGLMLIDAGIGDKMDEKSTTIYGIDRSRNLDHALAPIAKPAMRQPSTRRCGSCRMISRSLQVPGSDSSALITR